MKDSKNFDKYVSKPFSKRKLKPLKKIDMKKFSKHILDNKIENDTFLSRCKDLNIPINFL